MEIAIQEPLNTTENVNYLLSKVALMLLPPFFGDKFIHFTLYLLKDPQCIIALVSGMRLRVSQNLSNLE